MCVSRFNRVTSDSGNFRSLPYFLLSVPYFVLCLYKDSVFWYKEKKGFFKFYFVLCLYGLIKCVR